MKTTIKQFAAALIIAVITSVSIFGFTSNSDAKISKSFKLSFAHLSDSTDGNGGDTTDGSGGAGFPPKE
ncbi:MAG: hypothetical protein JST55_15080 [Bacteroidetes bacterium]|nr:hypothetical protein [Bacteroidota bacterium]